MKTFRDILASAPVCLQKRIIELANVEQRPDFHPEGDVLMHTMIVYKRLMKFREIDLLVAAFLHDIGKDVTTKPNEKGILQAIGHERVSAKVVFQYRVWIKSLGADPIVVFNIVKNHMRIKGFEDMRPVKQIKMVRHHPLAFAFLMAFRIADSMSTLTEEELKFSKGKS